MIRKYRIRTLLAPVLNQNANEVAHKLQSPITRWYLIPYKGWRIFSPRLKIKTADTRGKVQEPEKESAQVGTQAEHENKNSLTVIKILHQRKFIIPTTSLQKKLICPSSCEPYLDQERLYLSPPAQRCKQFICVKYGSCMVKPCSLLISIQMSRSNNETMRPT